MKLNDEYFKERADALVKEYGSGSVMHTTLRDKIYLLLKEVSKDTRHACAEACLSLVNGDIYKDKGTKSPYEAYVIAKNEASVACMNVVG